MRMDPKRPFCDGIRFSDLAMVRSKRHRTMLIERGLVYRTEFSPQEGFFTRGDIIAKDRQQARRIAFGRGLGEKVVGLEKDIYLPPGMVLPKRRRGRWPGGMAPL
jgi:hypothetical protein